MGILNTTPDSFSDGGKFNHHASAMVHARRMIAEGATIIDVGGESTRPGATPVGQATELARTIPIIRQLRSEWDGWISIDTTKAAVAEAALLAGADIVNDISGLLEDPEMPRVCAQFRCAIVVMHRQGNSLTMQNDPRYGDVGNEVANFFQQRHRDLLGAGIFSEAMCFDPGIGFGKTLEHNLTLLRNLPEFLKIGRPILLGVSRKSMIAKLLENSEIGLRDWPTVAISSWARAQGITLHRVHEVKRHVEALKMVDAVLNC